MAKRFESSLSNSSAPLAAVERAFFILSIALVFVVSRSEAGHCADIVGRVSTPVCDWIEGAHITAKTPDGEVVGSGTTDRKGYYEIKNLPEGPINLFLDSTSGRRVVARTDVHYQTGSAIEVLPSSGLGIFWRVSAANPAVAVEKNRNSVVAKAEEGCPFGLAWPVAIGAVGVPIVAGGAIGGYAAAGGFSGPAGDPPKRDPITPSR